MQSMSVSISLSPHNHTEIVQIQLLNIYIVTAIFVQFQTRNRYCWFSGSLEVA